jgi:hypothetical protein
MAVGPVRAIPGSSIEEVNAEEGPTCPKALKSRRLLRWALKARNSQKRTAPPRRIVALATRNTSSAIAREALASLAMNLDHSQSISPLFAIHTRP